MEKVLTSALAFAIFISSAAAEPIIMANEELELIHAGGATKITFAYPGINFAYSGGSAVVIQNGAEYQITEGSTLSLPGGTQVQLIQNGSGSTLLVTNGATNISASVSVSGGSASVSVSGSASVSVSGGSASVSVR
jgi:hypothetical protein